MNRVNPLLCFFFFLISCGEKDKKVPVAVEHAFMEKYSTAENAEWNFKENSYEVNFNQGDFIMEAEYDDYGKQLQEEKIIDKKDLPPAIKDYLKENYPQYFIGEASVEQKGEVVVYEIELLTGFFREIELEFDINGNFLSKESFKD